MFTILFLESIVHFDSYARYKTLHTGQVKRSRAESLCRFQVAVHYVSQGNILIGEVARLERTYR
jgi:hypothetical protein